MGKLKLEDETHYIIKEEKRKELKLPAVVK
jgi:hypothetical protein